MEQHLMGVVTSSALSFKIQHAAEKGLAKLRKYSVPAKLHHAYIVGTGTFLYQSQSLICITDCSVLVLHPCVHSHWFAAMADSEDPAKQDEAIKTAKIVFRYIAESYLETSTTTVVPPKTPPKPVLRTPLFLASACSFQQPMTATSATTVLKHTPLEELADELDRYLRGLYCPPCKSTGFHWIPVDS